MRGWEKQQEDQGRAPGRIVGRFKDEQAPEVDADFDVPFGFMRRAAILQALLGTGHHQAWSGALQSLAPIRGRAQNSSRSKNTFEASVPGKPWVGRRETCDPREHLPKSGTPISHLGSFSVILTGIKYPHLTERKSFLLWFPFPLSTSLQEKSLSWGLVWLTPL